MYIPYITIRTITWVNKSYQKHFNVDIPDPFSGKLTAKPSGKFCIPIPIAKFLKNQKKIPFY